LKPWPLNFDTLVLRQGLDYDATGLIEANAGRQAAEAWRGRIFDANAKETTRRYGEGEEGGAVGAPTVYDRQRGEEPGGGPTNPMKSFEPPGYPKASAIAAMDMGYRQSRKHWSFDPATAAQLARENRARARLAARYEELDKKLGKGTAPPAEKERVVTAPTPLTLSVASRFRSALQAGLENPWELPTIIPSYSFAKVCRARAALAYTVPEENKTKAQTPLALALLPPQQGKAKGLVLLPL
jgi:hypothetical protein